MSQLRQSIHIGRCISFNQRQSLVFYLPSCFIKSSRPMAHISLCLLSFILPWNCSVLIPQWSNQWLTEFHFSVAQMSHAPSSRICLFVIQKDSFSSMKESLQQKDKKGGSRCEKLSSLGSDPRFFQMCSVVPDHSKYLSAVHSFHSKWKTQRIFSNNGMALYKATPASEKPVVDKRG